MTTRIMGGIAAMLLVATGMSYGVPSESQTVPPAAAPKPEEASAGINSDWNAVSTLFRGFKADTKPSRDVVMQFNSATEVREIKVVGGQKVKKGEVLVKARDTEIVAAINQQRDLAENDLEIRGTEKQQELAEFKFKQVKATGNFSSVEFEEARIAAEVAMVQHDQAVKNKIQQDLKLKTYLGQYERYWLEAPFDGTIEEVMAEVGQGCTERDPVLRLVNTEKVWLDPYADTHETIRLNLKEGSTAWVLVDMPDAPKLVRGRVLYVSPVADSVSQTRRVRVEIDNPRGWPAGTQARVRFTEPGGEWDKYKATTSVTQTSDDVHRVVAEMVAEAKFRTSLLEDQNAHHPKQQTSGSEGTPK
jgi:RND family efflux transporter MFP subunit